MMKKKSNSFTLRLLLFVAVLLLLVVSGLTVLAQTEGADVWHEPLNISRSGGSTTPMVAQDSSGTYHLFWRDQFAGIEYAFGDGETWSESASPRFPFSTPPFAAVGDGSLVDFFTPVIAIDSQDRVHGLWVDADNRLFYSQAAVANVMAGAAGWSVPSLLGTNALQYQIVEGANGRLHLIYLLTFGNGVVNPGLVYRFSDDGGVSWAEPINIYSSDYYQTIAAEEANLHLVFSGAQTLFAAWDNRDLDTVFMMRSLDNGASWEAPQAVDQRREDDPLEAIGPSQIKLHVAGSNVNLTWRASHEEGQCGQYVQQSSDGGVTWLPAQLVFATGVECPADGRFLEGADGLLFLMTQFAGNVYLQAQDGELWSQPALQAPLTQFTNPITFRNVTFGCYQTAVTPQDHLLVFGCGTSNDEDIWLISRPLGGIENWSSRFAPTPIWSQPLPVATTTVQMLQPNLVVGGDDRLHVFWSQSENPVITGRIASPLSLPGSEIFYSRQDAGSWSAPRPILRSPSGSQADFLAVASDRAGSLFVAWAGNQPNGIYFSRALAERAASVSEWIEPLLLPAPRDAATWPSMVSDGGGGIFVAYTIPLNEARGIYLTRSTDYGDSWSDAVMVFDGATAEWDLIGPASLARTTDGTLHLLWTRRAQVPATQAVALAYARSDDNGATWTEPEIVTQEPLLRSAVLGVRERLVHRIWTGLLDNRPVLWHQFSEDGGLTWSSAGRVVDPAFVPGPTTLIADQGGNPLMLQLAEGTAGQLVLQEWVWRTDRWLEGERRVLQETAVNADTISAVAAPNGQIAVMYGTLLSEEGVVSDTLIYTNRQWEVPEAALTQVPLPTLTPTPQLLPTNTAVPQASSTPTATLSPVLDTPPLSSGSGGIIVGAAVALLLVVTIFVIGWRAIRTR
ncbi:MAG: exo-alpha-sialidase [Chloroflexota bacterium]